MDMMEKHCKYRSLVVNAFIKDKSHKKEELLDPHVHVYPCNNNE